MLPGITLHATCLHNTTIVFIIYNSYSYSICRPINDTTIINNATLWKKFAAKRARFRRFQILKHNQNKRQKHDNASTNTASSSNRTPLSEISLTNASLNSTNIDVVNGNTYPHYTNMRKTTQPNDKSKTPTKVFNIHKMGTNLLSKFSKVASNTEIENEVPVTTAGLSFQTTEINGTHQTSHTIA